MLLRESTDTDPDRAARFARAARLLVDQHSNIATIRSLEEFGAILMKIVEGPSLADRKTSHRFDSGRSPLCLPDVAARSPF
jgi:hypothetical protein